MTRLSFAAASRDRAALVHGVGQRLLAVDVLAGLEGQHGGRRVVVVGRGDQHRVDVLLVEQLAVIDHEAGLGESLAHLAGAVLVHVAQGHDFGSPGLDELIDVPASLALDADDAHVQPLVGRPALAKAREPATQKPAPTAAVCCRNSRRVLVRDMDDPPEYCPEGISTVATGGKPVVADGPSLVFLSCEGGGTPSLRRGR